MRSLRAFLCASIAGAALLSSCDQVGGQQGTQPNASQESDAEPHATWLADFAAMQRLSELGGNAFEAEQFEDAAAFYARASMFKDNVPGPTGQYLALFATAAYTKAGEPEKAVAMLKRSVDQGFRLADFAENYPDLAPLKDRDDFKAQIARARENAATYDASHRDPDTAKLIFDDVPRFWAAYDLAEKTDNKDAKAAIFRREYLAPGTNGLIDYHFVKTQSMEKLVDKIEESHGYYEGIRERTLSAAQYEPVIREGLRSIVDLYPEANVPDVTFVIGRLNSGGTAGPTGMLIGLDVWSWAEGIPLDGIPAGFQKVVTNLDLDALPFIVVHEHIHTLQQYGGEETLLLGALREGSADFIAGLAMPEQEKPHYYRWGVEREAIIWKRFAGEMDGDNVADWIGNNGSMDEEGWYADLGYFIGARICEDYYAQAEDKQQAIRDLLFVTDAKAILEASGYAARFTE